VGGKNSVLLIIGNKQEVVLRPSSVALTCSLRVELRPGCQFPTLLSVVAGSKPERPSGQKWNSRKCPEDTTGLGFSQIGRLRPELNGGSRR
jgi:hypothetical protein